MTTLQIRERVAFLRETELVGGAPDGLLARIAGDMEEVRAEAGTTIFREGDVGDAVYLVVGGTLGVEREGMQIARFGRGQCAGEFALVDGKPRSAAAVADSDVVMLKWRREDFHRILAENREVAYGIFRILTDRLRRETDVRVEKALEQERWRHDLNRAHEVQMGMLPEGDFSTDHYEISGICRAAADVGGDYYDYIQLNDDRLGVIVADVTDHGFYSGLFVAMAKSCLHTQATIDYAPDKVMEAMNRTLSMSIQSGLLMTCCYVLLDARAGTLTYTNGGHPYPYHYVRREDKLTRLPSTDMLLGVPGFEGSSYSTRESSWEPGDFVLLFSDGIPEAADRHGDMFDEERLEAVIMANRAESPAGMRDAVMAALAQHCGGLPHDDDITLAMVRAR